MAFVIFVRKYTAADFWQLLSDLVCPKDIRLLSRIVTSLFMFVCSLWCLKFGCIFALCCDLRNNVTMLLVKCVFRIQLTLQFLSHSLHRLRTSYASYSCGSFFFQVTTQYLSFGRRYSKLKICGDMVGHHAGGIVLCHRITRLSIGAHWKAPRI